MGKYHDRGAKWRSWQAVGVCGLLVFLVLLVFGQTVRHGFVNYDDNQYVYENPIVLKGISLEGLGWAFTNDVSGNWHPLTTISHMLDCQLFGLWAGGHHLTNLFLHLAASVLLFFVLLEMIGALWRSGFVAAVFAIHPLRVESVAWVAERKDVLSALFFMLTLLAYARYARRPGSRGRYAMVLLWFVLGLLSKPMLVTVPFVLLLLDYWPLGRMQYKQLLKEKLPLFALSALSSAATLIAQHVAILPMERLPLSLRAENALVACVVYLGKFVWPVKLAVLYPISRAGWPVWQVVAAILVLTGFTVGAVIVRRTQPFLTMGWFWYLGMLVPVIGILQVGQQAYADRYTYLPQIGLLIAATWLAAELAGMSRARRAALGISAMAVLFVLTFAACRQTAYWRNSETLWTHTLECTVENPSAHDNLGSALFRQGHTEEAVTHFMEALKINPNVEDAQNNLGIALLQQGQIDEAITHFREALRINPDFADANSSFGTALLRQGRLKEAAAQYREAVRINPALADAHNNLGVALFQLGQTEEALSQYREALRINPVYADARINLGGALCRQGQTEEAAAQYREALKINPSSAEARFNLSILLFKQGRAAEALSQAESALDLQPFNPDVENNLAFILATAPQASLRNGARAVQMATQANLSTGGKNPAVLRTLAAAYAGAGDYPKAVETANIALHLAEAQSSPDLAGMLQRDIKLYEAGRRFEEDR